MYGMTTLVPSMNIPVDGFGFLMRFALLTELCSVVVVLCDILKVIHFFCKKFRCRTYFILC